MISILFDLLCMKLKMATGYGVFPHMRSCQCPKQQSSTRCISILELPAFTRECILGNSKIFELLLYETFGKFFIVRVHE